MVFKALLDKDVAREDLERVHEFKQRNLHTVLTENPVINATMKALLGSDPFWLPIAEYRANAPAGGRAGGSGCIRLEVGSSSGQSGPES